MYDRREKMNFQIKEQNYIKLMSKIINNIDDYSFLSPSQIKLAGY